MANQVPWGEWDILGMESADPPIMTHTQALASVLCNQICAIRQMYYSIPHPQLTHVDVC